MSETSDEFLLRLVGTLNGAATTSGLALAKRTGILDALAEAPVTSGELAGRLGLSERHVRELLGLLTVARIVDHDPDGDTYHLPEHRAACLTGDRARNLAPRADSLIHLAGLAPEVERTVRDGGGLAYDVYQPWFTELQHEGTQREHDAFLLRAYVPAVDGLAERLEAGARVADVGCGSGHALHLLAEAFPASTYTGYDLNPVAVARASEEAGRRGLDNVTFATLDAVDLPTDPGFDVVLTFDAVHDQARPDVSVRRIREALTADGLYVMAEPAAASSVDANVDHPLAPMLYAYSLFHCMQVSLADDGLGLGTVWGRERAEELLRGAGFSIVEVAPQDANPFTMLLVARP